MFPMVFRLGLALILSLGFAQGLFNLHQPQAGFGPGYGNMFNQRFNVPPPQDYRLPLFRRPQPANGFKYFPEAHDPPPHLMTKNQPMPVFTYATPVPTPDPFDTGSYWDSTPFATPTPYVYPTFAPAPTAFVWPSPSPTPYF